MPSPVQFNITAGTLPPNFTGTPQQFLDAIADLLAVTPAEDWNSFLVGSSAPTANLGPWLKDGREWWVWSNDDGAYVPVTVDNRSLRRYIGDTAPSNDEYDVWYQTNSSGVPQAVKIWNAGSWVDIYAAQFSSYYSKTEMETAFAKFSTYTGSDLFVPAGSAAVKVPFNAVTFEIGTSFNTGDNRFSAPANGYYRLAASLRMDATSVASPTGMGIVIEIRVNGVPVRVAEFLIGDQANGTTLPVDGIFMLNQNDYAEIWVSVIIATGTATWKVTADNRKTVFEGHRIA